MDLTPLHQTTTQAPQARLDQKWQALVWRPVSGLRPYANNARTHGKKQIAQIADSIRQFGFTNPVLIGADGEIIAGHGRVAAAKLLGLTEVPTLLLGHLSAAERRAYVLADNKLALNAGWDQDILAIELQGLIDLEFDVELTGFSMAEVDLVLDLAADSKSSSLPGSDAAADEALPAPLATPITQLGDVWQLGRHRLICGDARLPDTYTRLLMGERVDLVFTDPPYNVPIDGHVSGLGSVKHREFAFASGEMSQAQFTAFLTASLGAMAQHCRDGAIAFVCMDWRHMRELLNAGYAVFSELKNMCVWNKTNGGMGAFYRSKHELVFVWKVGTAPHTNTFGLGDTGRYRTNVWDYAGISSISATRSDELEMHPTVKPVALVADAIKDCSRRGEIVLDGFAGSLHDQLMRDGIEQPLRSSSTGRSFGGKPFHRGQLYDILNNALYVGCIRHGSKTYAGKHPGIIDQQLWDQVQAQLKANTQGERVGPTIKDMSLLVGKLLGPDDEPLVAVHANKGKVRYRYYVSRHLQHGTAQAKATADGNCEGVRVPAKEIERLVITALIEKLNDPIAFGKRLGLPLQQPALATKIVAGAAKLVSTLRGKRSVAVQTVLAQITQRIRVLEERVEVVLSIPAVATALGADAVQFKTSGDQDAFAILLPVRLKRSGVAVKLVQETGVPANWNNVNIKLLTAIGKGRAWWAQLLADPSLTVSGIAAAENVHASYIDRMIRLVFLAPSIVQDVLKGTAPADFNLDRLKDVKRITPSWATQRQNFGFTAARG